MREPTVTEPQAAPPPASGRDRPVMGRVRDLAKPAIAGLPALRRRRVVRERLEAEVANRRVLITGASRGIGRELALLLAGAGAQVMIAARSEDALEEVAGLAAEVGPTATPYVCDMASAEDVDALVARVQSDHGGADVLINNAGRSIRRRIDDSYSRHHDFERTMATNYYGPVRLTLGLLPGMVRRGRGQIVNVSSIGLQTHMPRFSAYNASKAALDAFARSLAPEVTPAVRVTVVYMALVATAMSAPTRSFWRLPALTDREAAEILAYAIARRSHRVSSPVGLVGELAYAAWPAAVENFMAITDRFL